MTWFNCNGKKRKSLEPAIKKTRGYYRTGITANDFRLAMEDAGLLSISQITAMVADKIPPEAKARHYELYEMGHGPSNKPIELKLFYGARRVVTFRCAQLVIAGKVRKHGTGKEAKFEWIAPQASGAKKDSSRRRHTKSQRTRPGRD